MIQVCISDSSSHNSKIIKSEELAKGSDGTKKTTEWRRVEKRQRETSERKIQLHDYTILVLRTLAV